MIYSFYGLRRSGNHAILEWLLYNMGNKGNRVCYKVENGSEKVISRDTAFYFNDVSRYTGNHIQLCYDVISSYEIGAKDILVTYEDKSISYKLIPSKTNIIVIRDILNVLASRIKNSNAKNPRDMRIDEEIIGLWKEHASDENSIKILYEKWLTSKEYRDSICERLNISNFDNTKNVYSFGGGSSFTGEVLDSKENLLNRYKHIDLPNNIKKMVCDKTIVDLRKKLGYIK